ncbi:MAG: Bor family protein [Acidobacteriota bacterium]|nr:Bor family protein [Acidobacteriota bacterium]
MKKLSTLLTVAALVLPLGACMQHTYVLGAGTLDDEIVYKHWHHHWLFGLIRPQLQEKVDIDKLCPSGDAVIHQEASFANGIIDWLTFFIYSPTTVTVTCAGGEGDAMAAVELSADEVMAIASDPRFHEAVRHLAPQRLDELEAALADR